MMVFEISPLVLFKVVANAFIISQVKEMKLNLNKWSEIHCEKEHQNIVMEKLPRLIELLQNSVSSL